MKTTLMTMLAITLLTGCTYNYPYSRSTIGASCKPVPLDHGSQYTLVNNTGVPLKVYVDGDFLGECHPGDVVPIKGALLWRRTVVTVTGCNQDGSYIGANSWIYEFGTPEAWTVHTLNRPREPR